MFLNEYCLGWLMNPTLRILRNIAPALDRAGSGAWADMWRVAPPLAALALAMARGSVDTRMRSSNDQSLLTLFGS